VDGADLSEVPDNSTPSPLSQVLRMEKGFEVRKQLIQLPKKYKVPLVLRYYKQMSYSEIAHALKSRLSAVRMMIFRGKEQLRHNLRREQPGKNQPTRCRYRATRSLRELGDMMGPLVVGEPSHLKPHR